MKYVCIVSIEKMNIKQFFYKFFIFVFFHNNLHFALPENQLTLLNKSNNKERVKQGKRMTYEYGTGQQGLNYPNPYKIENVFLMIRSAMFLIGAIFCFIIAKMDLDQNNIPGFGLNLFLAVAFLVGVISTSITLSQQIRVYFGRGQPRSLAKDISPDEEGFSPEASHLKETIRQGALSLAIPTGALNGFLYNYFKDLIIAPPEVQYLTQRSFANLIKMLIVGVLFGLSSFFALGSNATGVTGIYFIMLVMWIVINPIIKKEIKKVDLSLNTFWKLFALALLIPIAIIIVGKHLPNLNEYYFSTKAFILLGLAIAGELFLLKSLQQQLEQPTGITTAFEQEAVTFNAPPNQLIFDIERKLQEQWQDTIPNRIYSRIMPKVNLQTAGSFKGQIIQETQPVAPKALEEGQNLEYILSDSRKKFLFYVDILSTMVIFMAIVGLTSLLYRTHQHLEQHITHISWIPLFIGLVGLGVYWMRVTHSLWGRFDFESKLYIFDLEGNYATAKVNFGNALNDSFQTNKNVINIEDMTLRVWVTHLRTSVFGHGVDSDRNLRRIIKMTGLKDESKHWLNIVKQFAQNQSMIVSPTSQEDMKRATALAQINNVTSSISNNRNMELTHQQKGVVTQLKNGDNNE